MSNMQEKKSVPWHALAALTGAAVFTTSAFADVYGYDHGANNRMWGVNYMPDLDQVRGENPGFIDGLPGNGTMYCIPTCGSNIAAYTTWRGLGPWPQSMNWTSSYPGIYNAATGHIRDLGDAMGTSATDGTSYPGIYNGAADLFSGIPFDVSYFRVGGGEGWTWSPKTDDLVSYGLAGGLVDIVFGRYEWHLGGPDYVVTDDRVSGHCLTLTRGTITPGGNEIRFRDPGSGGDELTQSAYTTHTRVAEDFWVNRFGLDVQMTVIIPPNGWIPDTDQIPIIDSTLIIWPAWIFLDPPDSGGDLAVEPNPTRRNPMGGAMLPVVELQTPTIPHDPIAFAVRPDRQCVAYSYRITPTVCALQTKGIIGGEMSQLITLPDVRAMAYGRFMELYVLTDREVIRYATDQGRMTELSRWALPRSADPRAIAYHDLNDEVWVLEPSLHLIYRSDHALETSLRALDLEPQASGDPLLPVENTTISMYIHHRDGQLWIANDLSTRVARYARNPGQPDQYVPVQIITGGTLRPTDVQMDSRGRLLVASGNAIREYADLNADGLVEQVAPIYTGMHPHRKFEITTSRSNDATTPDELPGWHHVLIPNEFGEGEPDCRADFDGSGRVDSNDFFAFLQAFFAGRFNADANSDGTVNSGDFFDFLQYHFAGCP